MKIKLGPGIRELQLLSNEGEDLLGELHVCEIIVRMDATNLPTATIECEIFGDEHELEIKEDQIVANLTRRGITRIEGRREQSET